MNTKFLLACVALVIALGAVFAVTEEDVALVEQWAELAEHNPIVRISERPRLGCVWAETGPSFRNNRLFRPFADHVSRGYGRH